MQPWIVACFFWQEIPSNADDFDRVAWVVHALSGYIAQVISLSEIPPYSIASQDLSDYRAPCHTIWTPTPAAKIQYKIYLPIAGYSTAGL